ncbi:MAG: trypsin-like peptidase domain-containing protein [Caulobacteraceae bacterium]
MRRKSAVSVFSSIVIIFSAVQTAQATTEQEYLSTSENSVVRISIVRTDDQGNHLESSGSGFVVAPGTIVTNFHVVSDAVGRDDESIVVTAESASIPRLTGTLTVSWPEADLALVEVPASSLQPLTLGPASISQTAVVRAVGYPGVTCLALGCTADEIVAPSEPTATVGNVSHVGNRLPNGTALPSLFHTAPTSPGSSGGPLVDECGRVVGVDAWAGRATIDSSGDVNVPSDLNIAIGVDALRQFLRGNGVAFKEDLAPCAPTSAVDQQLAQTQAELAAARVALAHPAPPTSAAFLAAHLSQIVEMVALALVLAIVSLTVWWRFRRRVARAPNSQLSAAEGIPEPVRSTGMPGFTLAVSGAIAALVGVMAIFHGVRMPPPANASQSQPSAVAANPPNADDTALNTTTVQPASAVSSPQIVHLACMLATTQSFNPLPESETNDFGIETASACVNGRTPYERTASGFTRVMLMDATRTVSVMDLTSDLGTFRRRDFVLSPNDYLRFRTAAQWSGRPRCEVSSVSILARLRVAAQPYVAGVPARITTWNCVRSVE